jgi:phosphoacetylglucosamine mutase
MACNMNQLIAASQAHPKPSDFRPRYGTAGFRDDASKLDSTVFRCGLLAGLRALDCGQRVGLMVTASHNPEKDNGVKLVEPSGEMLAAVWEQHASELANAETDQALWEAVTAIIAGRGISCASVPGAVVVVATDTRPSSATLAASAKDGVALTGAAVDDLGLRTTPMLHWAVTEPTMRDVDAYCQTLANAFQDLCDLQCEDEPPGMAPLLLQPVKG